MKGPAIYAVPFKRSTYLVSEVNLEKSLPALREYRSNVWKIEDPRELSDVVFRLREGGHRVKRLSQIKSRKLLRPFFEDRTVATGNLQPMKGSLHRLLPRHYARVDLCGRGTLPWFALPPVSLEVINDRLGLVVNLFSCLRREGLRLGVYLLSRLVGDFAGKAVVPLLSSSEGRKRFAPSWAWATYLRAERLLEGRLERQGRRVLQHRHPEEVFARREALDLYHQFDRLGPRMGDVHGRLLRMQIEDYPIEKVIKFYDSPQTLFWVDPDPSYRSVVFSALKQVKGSIAVYEALPQTSAVPRDLLKVGKGWEVHSLMGGETLYLNLARNSTT